MNRKTNPSGKTKPRGLSPTPGKATNPAGKAAPRGAGASATFPKKCDPGEPGRPAGEQAGPQPGTDPRRDLAPPAGLGTDRVDPKMKEAVDAKAGRIKPWPLSRLKPHPRQDASFHPMSDQDLNRLADDLRANGQLTPVEALPDGTTLAGHQRLRAARLLGWTELSVWVRDDLAGDEVAAERRLLEDNLTRRQLDVLDRVRASKRLVELRRRKPPGGLTGHQQHDLRDEIARELGKSGRHVQRYLNVLKAAMPCQRLFSAGVLPLKFAERLGDLPEAIQLRIAREIEGGGSVAAVVAAHLPARPTEVDVDKEMNAFFKAGSRALDALGGREGEVGLPQLGVDFADYIKTLKRMGTMIAKVVEGLRRRRKDWNRSLRSCGRLASRSRDESWD